MQKVTRKPLDFDIFRSEQTTLLEFLICTVYVPNLSTIRRIFVELRTKYCKKYIFGRYKSSARLLVVSRA